MSCRSKKCQSVLYFSMSIMFCLSSSHELFLNSHAHCGRTGRGETDDGSVPYSVGESTTFTVKDDVSPSTKTEAFRECQMVFQSQRRDGRLYLMQRHWKIESCEMRLELFDGLAGTDGVKSPNVTMDCAHSLKSVEWCTTGRYLTLGVAKGGLQPSMKKVEVDFGVYDIRNKNRQVFMDSMPNCGSKFQLDSSQVTVSNLNPNLNTKPMFLCSLTFDYVGLEENKTVCLVFKSGISRSQCSAPYNLTVYSQQPNNKGYLEMLRFYISTSRQLRRLDSKFRSPIYSHFSETLQGCSIVRSFGAQNRFVEQAEKKIDEYTRFCFHLYAGNGWLGFRLSVLGALVVLITALVAVATRQAESAGLMGLAFLYSGSDLRSNLDPFSQYSDDEVWRALNHAHLQSFVASLPDGLEHDCGEGGNNLSVGQRQLVCLARTLLRKNRVLDEVTAAVDMETDDLIQQTLRTQFAECTILTIAHRLNTIMDYDKILVLEKGRVVAFDTPQHLLQDPDNIFYKMVESAGLLTC